MNRINTKSFGKRKNVYLLVLADLSLEVKIINYVDSSFYKLTILYALSFPTTLTIVWLRIDGHFTHLKTLQYINITLCYCHMLSEAAFRS